MNKPRDLEDRLTLKNKYRTAEGDKKVEYIGKVSELYINEDGYLIGRVTLEKHTKPKERKDFQPGWKVSSSDVPFINSKRQLLENYKTELKNLAAKKGLKMPEDILKEVFKPMESKLLEVYDNFYASGMTLKKA